MSHNIRTFHKNGKEGEHLEAPSDNKKGCPKRPDGFAPLPAIVRFSNLTWFQKIIYGEILSLSQQKNYAWVSNSTLASWYNVSPRYVSQAINKLEELHFVKIIHNPGRGREVYPRHQELVGKSKGVEQMFQGGRTNVLGDRNNSSKGVEDMFYQKENKKENKKENTHKHVEKSRVCDVLKGYDKGSSDVLSEEQCKQKSNSGERCLNVGERVLKESEIDYTLLPGYVADRMFKYIVANRKNQTLRIRPDHLKTCVFQYWEKKALKGDFDSMFFPDPEKEKKEFEKWLSQHISGIKYFQAAYIKNHGEDGGVYKRSKYSY